MILKNEDGFTGRPYKNKSRKTKKMTDTDEYKVFLQYATTPV